MLVPEEPRLTSILILFPTTFIRENDGWEGFVFEVGEGVGVGVVLFVSTPDASEIFRITLFPVSEMYRSPLRDTIMAVGLLNDEDFPESEDPVALPETKFSMLFPDTLFRMVVH